MYIYIQTYDYNTYIYIYIYNVCTHIHIYYVEHMLLIGWADGHFDNLHFRNSLEAKNTLGMGIGQSLSFCFVLTCRLLK